MPAWHPDADVDSAGKPKPLFIEEAIFQNENTRKFGPFPMPGQKTGVNVSFAEPPNDAPDADWRSFNKWILGGSIPNPPADIKTEKAMTTMLRELAVLVRRYNASLYRLRRLHFFVHSTTSPNDELPPKNKFGDPVLPPAGATKIENLVNAAETDWQNVTAALEQFIGDKPPTKHTYSKIDKAGNDFDATVSIGSADMVEVNGYIVSMRVLATVKQGDALEIGMSSSSHVSISSAFSSS